jgi:type II secretory pathway component PulL
MSKPSHLILASEAGWSVAFVATDLPATIESIDLPDGASADVVAETIASRMRQHGYTGRPVVLAIPSSWCLVAAIDTTGLPRKATRAAMTFRLEERLPISAEDVAADFIIHDNANEALGMCVRTNRLADAIAQLESRGVAVGHVVPRAMLVVRELLKQASDDVDVLSWPEEGRVNVVKVRNGRPAHWSLCQPNAVARQVRLISENDPPRILSMADSAGEEERLVCAGAAAVASGNAAPLVDLLRDGLAVGGPYRRLRMPITAVLAVGVVFLLALACALLVRAGKYQDLAMAYEDEQRQLFRSAFPDAAEPVDVRLRIESEYRRATRQATGASGNDAAAIAPVAALTTLHHVLSAAAGDGTQPLPFTLDRMDFRENGGFDLAGKTMSYVVVDDLARTIASKTRIVVQPPQASRLADGSAWTFNVRGEPAAVPMVAPVSSTEGLDR